MNHEDIKRKVRACVAKMPQRVNIQKVSLFGSYLHAGEKPDSDIDLLIELENPVGYFELVRMQDALEMSLGQKVDLVEPEALSKYFRAKVLAEARTLYEG